MVRNRIPRTEVCRSQKDTLCWYCRNAVPSPKAGTGCSWSREHTPVRGWLADRRDVPHYYIRNGRQISDMEESYRVVHCPDFQRG